jgi:hypothetical protein
LTTSHTINLTGLTAGTLYHYRVRATDGANNAATSGDFTFATAAPPNFTIAATPPARSVAPGGSATYTVTIGALNGFTGAVNLSVTGLPAGASASFSPASVNGSGTATLTVTAGLLTPLGTSTLTIKGDSGALSHTATVQFEVKLLGGVLSVNFAANSGDVMTASQNAGVIRKANWNSATGADSTAPLTLKDETGTSTNVTMTWSSDNVWQTTIGQSGGNRRMMKGYLDNGFGGVISVTLAGLPHATYDVYVYVDGDNGGDRTGSYRISGPGITPTTVSLTDIGNTHFNGTFVEAADSSGNYVKFRVTGSGFTITATPSATSDGRMRAPVNGMQIVPV